MRQPAASKKPRPQKVRTGRFGIPTGGWISNRALDTPGAGMPGAAVLENFFPMSTAVVLRRGSRRWATAPVETPIVSLFTYSSGEKVELFASTNTQIYNITTVASPLTWALAGNDDEAIAADDTPGSEVVIGEDSLAGLGVWPCTDGDWITVQFSTAGGTFLLGVNGVDEGFIYDGTTWAGLDATITFPDDHPDLTTADLSYVWSYQGRIWFIQKNSLDAWYLPVDQIGGELVKLPLGGMFPRGGTLLWGQAWSLTSGGDGGLSDQCVFCSTEGEITAYQGIDPSSASGWSKVGTYRVGRPMGRKCIARAGGDILIATTVGLISLSMAADLDMAALGAKAVSYPIEDAWAEAIRSRGSDDWRVQIWADEQMMIVSPQYSIDAEVAVFVCNTVTGAWCKFTNWDARSIAAFRGGLYFGTNDGRIMQGWVGGHDDEAPYVGRLMPLFDKLGAPASMKTPRMARVQAISKYPANESIAAVFNFRKAFPAAPIQAPIQAGSQWDNGIWDESIWNEVQNDAYSARWRSVSGSGTDVSFAIQVTSGNNVPFDTQIIGIDFTYEIAGIVT